MKNVVVVVGLLIFASARLGLGAEYAFKCVCNEDAHTVDNADVNFNDETLFVKIRVSINGGPPDGDHGVMRKTGPNEYYLWAIWKLTNPQNGHPILEEWTGMEGNTHLMYYCEPRPNQEKE